MESTAPASPHSLRTVLIVAALLACLSLGFSFVMFWLQAGKPDDHVTGKVLSVATSSITIVSARGATTTLLITPDTKIGDISPLSELATGTPVMAAGEFLEPGVFAAEGIRTFNKRK